MTEERVRGSVESYGRDKGDREPFVVCDVAFRVAGIGSLGLHRYAVLVRGGGSDSYRLLDIKEVRPSALRPCAEGPQPGKGTPEARRSVLAQRQLQSRPTTGLDVVAIDDCEFRMRELIPEENRTGLDELRKQPKKLRRAVALAGRLTGWAHVRGARSVKHNRTEDLGRWADGPGLDAVIVSAIRFAIQSKRDYRAFLDAYSEQLIKP